VDGRVKPGHDVEIVVANRAALDSIPPGSAYEWRAASFELLAVLHFPVCKPANDSS
jgi:hypothetical protein